MVHLIGTTMIIRSVTIIVCYIQILKEAINVLLVIWISHLYNLKIFFKIEIDQLKF